MSLMYEYKSWLKIAQDGAVNSNDEDVRNAYNDVIKLYNEGNSASRVQELLFDIITYELDKSMTYREIILYTHQLIDTSPINEKKDVLDQVNNFNEWLKIQDKELVSNLRCIEDAVKLFNLGFKGFDNSGILHAGLFNSQAQFERTLKVTIGYVPLTKKDD